MKATPEVRSWGSPIAPLHQRGGGNATARGDHCRPPGPANPATAWSPGASDQGVEITRARPGPLEQIGGEANVPSPCGLSHTQAKRLFPTQPGLCGPGTARSKEATWIGPVRGIVGQWWTPR